MPAAIMTYDELANAWAVSREAARKKVEGLRLQKRTGKTARSGSLSTSTRFSTGR